MTDCFGNEHKETGKRTDAFGNPVDELVEKSSEKPPEESKKRKKSEDNK